ncbi:pyridoxal phosphate-dependent aminotransferase [Alishewanella sp. 16-MA]|uniref:alanine transaminase n=1 Tax=Alishewanella maricola TaxID=2795740 RepID=A0ABS8C3H4_9ALTE|nr:MULTISPECIES: pyridoxal phosphate-dependent aminotransferase [Gammaproteobacteria]MDP5035405.1 pyridoxal phosphate-dependent aminotransferase [Alishewanella sp.]MCB5226883.1 pyridoxal phosphate-dependent aminotransferase [Alishewanella maricola]MCF4009915.1 pyridoxal phosphate-dependent aminotransferase [Rheinheimera sp. UJ63]MDP5187842.1 pyridoxal phosphate-dependent aminotransferase [Alishewanella sp.]MDP5457954.1 pyridoxal phosphate-dependent aminotransferase [Alishewanella sp. SMS8]
MKPIERSTKLDGVCYDIRGPVAREAKRMEEEGHRILKLNIGNPAPFGFEAPDEILKHVIHNLPTAQGYSDSQGIYPARVAVAQYYQQRGIRGADADDVYIGNGVSELILMALQGLLNTADEVLVPMPDYPLWTAAVNLAGGKAVHYLCDEQQDWYPSLEDIKAKISKKTRAIVLINPNNPTGAVYSPEFLRELLEIARQHKLVVMSDEIYDKVLYDGTEHVSTAALADDLVMLTFGGLSKNYRIAGFRIGWLFISGAKKLAKNYIEGLNILASMRLCANVPCQHAVQTALGGYQSINELTVPGGRLYDQMDLAHKLVNEIDGVSCMRPKGAMYLFPKIDLKKYHIKDDELFVLDFLRQHKVLLVHGRAFNWPEPDHFRIVTLPHKDQLRQAISKLAQFLPSYSQE